MSARDDDPPAEDFEVSDAPARGQERALRVIVAIVAAIVITTMLIVPILRFLAISNEQRDPETAAREARRYVAGQFSAAALDARSTRAAARWALPGLEATIDAEIVGFLQSRDPALIAGTEVTLATSSCPAGTPPRAECFQAWLRAAGAPEVIRIAFAVAIVSGRATVVRVSVLTRLEQVRAR